MSIVFLTIAEEFYLESGSMGRIPCPVAKNNVLLIICIMDQDV